MGSRLAPGRRRRDANGRLSLFFFFLFSPFGWGDMFYKIIELADFFFPFCGRLEPQPLGK